MLHPDAHDIERLVASTPEDWDPAGPRTYRHRSSGRVIRVRARTHSWRFSESGIPLGHVHKVGTHAIQDFCAATGPESRQQQAYWTLWVQVQLCRAGFSADTYLWDARFGLLRWDIQDPWIPEPPAEASALNHLAVIQHGKIMPLGSMEIPLPASAHERLALLDRARAEDIL